MDRITSMEAFVRVVEAGSFAEAARRWGRSKAVVSKYVAQLEEHLGARLLQRTTRSLALTEAGSSHFERCRQVLALVEESEAQVRAEHASARGTLRISAPPGFLTLYRQAVVTDFVRRYPDVRLEIDGTHRLVDLVEERIDVAIRLTDPEDSTLVARRLGPAPLVLVASPDHLAAAGVPRHPKELADRSCVLDTNFRFHPRWPLRADGRRISVEVSGPVRVNSPLLVRDLARDGLGIALVPRMVVAADLEAGSLVEVLPGSVDIEWSVYAVTSQRRYLTARARAFVDHLRLRLGDPCAS